jgi:hypothetical protein
LYEKRPSARTGRFSLQRASEHPFAVTLKPFILFKPLDADWYIGDTDAGCYRDYYLLSHPIDTS